MARSTSQTDNDVDETLENQDDDDDDHAVPPKPIGGPIKRRGGTKLYGAFEHEGRPYELEDTVLVSPAVEEKPYVAIIKDIVGDLEGQLTVHGQWFYRPEEVEKRGIKLDDDWDNRELYYSFHFDEMPADSIMHKCVIHYVPLGDQLPDRFEQPGMFVRRFFDHVNDKCLELTDQSIKNEERHEIQLLIQKTQQCLKGHQINLETTRIQGDNPLRTGGQRSKTNTQEHVRIENNKVDEHECETILAKRNALTGDKMRDVGLKKLLEAVWCSCILKEKSLRKNNVIVENCLEDVNGIQDAGTSDVAVGMFSRLDDAVQAISSLEKLVYRSFQAPTKYNQKMRQLAFNFKKHELLAERFLNKELEAAVILNMTPEELKDGQVTQEKPEEPAWSKHMQMTDARCSRCSKKNVGVSDVIGGGSKERYLMECLSCGNTWYASPGAHC